MVPRVERNFRIGREAVFQIDTHAVELAKRWHGAEFAIRKTADEFAFAREFDPIACQ